MVSSRPLLSHQAIFGMPFLSDNNLVVDAAVRRVIQVPGPAEGREDVYRNGNVYRSGDIDVPMNGNFPFM
jgi:hypothetical protein